ncbi:TIGR03857 family LLM class F420-dependent oxidoreductase [[Mycobacterium] wendilense]|uniref:TIGR03857 family LLM class F420-dependent oxidoreductase n=1 Tax=[Mycobacterium] wendilense TaxID=3064284 RepID=A0ABM9MBD9_9MYCO|nr:TIGR03857 family LLM class F420-dependent oxidoreductase [Mycolicibacterium sp. MU0050]CAJ1581028.1 TIGR03857 family LLM class F420-dependent oxidoreductase [Mycolicibacterium sp. MU0050]
MTERMPEIGFYTLAGQAEQPRDLIAEVRDAERLGLGECFVSERFSTKEAATICGAVGAVSESIGITTGATNHNIRHPIVTAAHATTMHRLTGGRFTLGLGRGIVPVQRAFGIPEITTAQMEDFARVMRRLFRGETVVGHDGPMGSYPALRLDPNFDEDVKLALVAFGPNSLALGGRAFDKVILHTFFTDETLQRCVRTVKEAAEAAGRDPAQVEVWSCLATIGDHLPEELRLRKTVGRLATYLQGYGDLMVRTNNWDPAVLERFRQDPIVQSFQPPGGALKVIDSPSTTVEQLEHIATLLPDEWLAPSATGSPAQCATTVKNQLDLGADGVILHGASPTELKPILPEYRAIRSRKATR